MVLLSGSKGKWTASWIYTKIGCSLYSSLFCKLVFSKSKIIRWSEINSINNVIVIILSKYLGRGASKNGSVIKPELLFSLLLYKWICIVSSSKDINTGHIAHDLGNICQSNNTANIDTSLFKTSLWIKVVSLWHM